MQWIRFWGAGQHQLLLILRAAERHGNLVLRLQVRVRAAGVAVFGIALANGPEGLDGGLLLAGFLVGEGDLQ